MNQLNYINQPLFGHGSVGNISEVLRDMGITKPLICTDPGLSEIGMLDQVRSLISNEFTPIVFDQTPANPTQEAVEQAFDKYKEEEQKLELQTIIGDLTAMHKEKKGNWRRN